MKSNVSLVLSVTVALFVVSLSTVMAGPPPPSTSVPDAGSTAALLTIAGFGVTAMRRFIGRGK